MGSGLNIDQIIASLDNVKKAEDVFASNLVAEEAPEEEVSVETLAAPDAEDTEEVTEETTPEVETDIEVTAEVETEKVADFEERGRQMARGFFEELTKIASYNDVQENLEEITKYAEAADTLLAAEYGNDYEAADVEKLASLMIDNDKGISAEITETPEVTEVEKTAEEVAGEQIITNLYNKYYGGK